jgi:endogenous inhibitor of DNA gyrase (YacG/DUF329 family)
MKRSKRCTQCGKRFSYTSVKAHAWFPFCSEKCKVVDLGAWLSDEYAVVEDLSRGNQIKDKLDLNDPDIQAALDELE